LDTIENLIKLAIAGAVLQMYGAIIIIGTFSVVAAGAGAFLFVYYKAKAKVIERFGRA
jgi:hypothetical protein